MTVAIVYVFPNMQLPTYAPLAQRFVKSYMDFPSGQSDHDLHVMVNGAPATEQTKKLFDPLPVRFHQHNNFAKDIGAFILAAATIPCDVMFCLGSHIHFHRAGWLDRLLDIYLKNGPGLYGCWGFNQPSPHIRTTAFLIPPALLASYPHPMDNDHRYEFEHGRDTSILRWTLDCGLPVGMVTWQHVRMFPKFDHVAKEDCLVLDQHQDRLAKQK